MLKKRLLSAVFLIPVIIASILWLPTFQLALVLAFFVMAGAWEWCALSGLCNKTARLPYCLMVAILLLLSYDAINSPLLIFIMAVTALWWVFCLINIMRLNRVAVDKSPALQQGHGQFSLLLRLLIGLIVLVPTWLAMLALHNIPSQGPQLLVFLMLLIWVADSGAYFVGKRFGKSKLAPNISPGKTKEGAFGAVVAGVLLAVLASYPLAYDALWLVFICVLTIIFSIVGDLYESLYKRRAGMKDSGSLIPGHGGVLDRIDSLTAAAPIFLLLVLSLSEYAMTSAPGLSG